MIMWYAIWSQVYSVPRWNQHFPRHLTGFDMIVRSIFIKTLDLSTQSVTAALAGGEVRLWCRVCGRWAIQVATSSEHGSLSQLVPRTRSLERSVFADGEKISSVNCRRVQKSPMKSDKHKKSLLGDFLLWFGYNEILKVSSSELKWISLHCTRYFLHINKISRERGRERGRQIYPGCYISDI